MMPSAKVLGLGGVALAWCVVVYCLLGLMAAARPLVRKGERL